MDRSRLAHDRLLSILVCVLICTVDRQNPAPVGMGPELAQTWVSLQDTKRFVQIDHEP